MRLHVVFDFFFKFDYIRLILNNFLLRISHIFVLLDLHMYLFGLFLNRQTKLFQKVQPVSYKFILPLIQTCNIGLYMTMVEHRIASLHWIDQNLLTI